MLTGCQASSHPEGKTSQSKCGLEQNNIKTEVTNQTDGVKTHFLRVHKCCIKTDNIFRLRECLWTLKSTDTSKYSK